VTVGPEEELPPEEEPGQGEEGDTTGGAVQGQSPPSSAAPPPSTTTTQGVVTVGPEEELPPEEEPGTTPPDSTGATITSPGGTTTTFPGDISITKGSDQVTTKTPGGTSIEYNLPNTGSTTVRFPDESGLVRGADAFVAAVFTDKGYVSIDPEAYGNLVRLDPMQKGATVYESKPDGTLTATTPTIITDPSTGVQQTVNTKTSYSPDGKVATTNADSTPNMTIQGSPSDMQK
jgi:hypothetical protein